MASNRVIQAGRAGNYVDTGAGYGSDPFLDPDGRVIRVDRYGIVGRTIRDRDAGQRQNAFDEAGRQYELEREVFVAANTVLPSACTARPHGNARLHGLFAGQQRTPRSPERRIFPPGPSTTVLTRTVFDPGDAPCRYWRQHGCHDDYL